MRVIVQSRVEVTREAAAQACAEDSTTLPVMKVGGAIWHFKDWLIEFARWNEARGGLLTFLHLSTFLFLL